MDEILIGDRSYSSWSLRGWLLYDAFGIPVKVRTARLYEPAFAETLANFVPARTVPVVRFDDGAVVPETLAMAEELASRHPEAGIWPTDPGLRAQARWLAAEMHSGFSALRNFAPMNLRQSYSDSSPPPAVLADLARIEDIWGLAISRSGGPWLCGEYSAADAFYAPVAARIAGYNLPVGTTAANYAAMHLAHPSFRRWRAMGLVEGPAQPVYARDYPQRPWPGEPPIAAAPVADGVAENPLCPYSGRPVTHLMRIGGRVFGFCNAFCRDKTVADPAAWPAFMKIYQS